MCEVLKHRDQVSVNRALGDGDPVCDRECRAGDDSDCEAAVTNGQILTIKCAAIIVGVCTVRITRRNRRTVIYDLQVLPCIEIGNDQCDIGVD